MSANPTQFMVDFTLPEELSEQFFELIPYQRVVVDKYLSEGKLINYAFSLQGGKLWAVFNAESEMQVMEMLIDFPLTEFMEVQINLLDSFNTFNQPTPQFSLN
ncbi:MAG: hypothetical protein R3350_01530 [Saprospiraceae bacterium]|nr:hypothetical protein [Saprospiraceae bacterium]